MRMVFICISLLLTGCDDSDVELARTAQALQSLDAAVLEPDDKSDLIERTLFYAATKDLQELPCLESTSCMLPEPPTFRPFSSSVPTDLGPIKGCASCLCDGGCRLDREGNIFGKLDLSGYGSDLVLGKGYVLFAKSDRKVKEAHIQKKRVAGSFGWFSSPLNLSTATLKYLVYRRGKSEALGYVTAPLRLP